MSVRILVGDVRDRIKDIPDSSIHCVVTSPPYMGLRDYGTAQWDGGDPACDHRGPGPNVGNNRNIRGKNADDAEVSLFSRRKASDDGHQRAVVIPGNACIDCGAVRIDNQIGLEPTLADYIATMVDVFREVKRVLRPDGTCWLNIGDSYAGSWGNQGRKDERGTQRPINGGMLTPVHDGRYPANGNNTGVIRDAGLKPKDLMMVPARLAIALQDDGWYIRSDIIWHKRAPMPESVTDRPTSAHEHIFLLTKSPRYFYDATAVAEESLQPNGEPALTAQHKRGVLQNLSASTLGTNQGASTRNMRNVWTLSPEPFPAAHFATFPTEIPRRAIRAGTSEKGACGACGAPWKRITEREGTYAERKALGYDKAANWWVSPTAHNGIHPPGKSHDLDAVVRTAGWEPSCACDAAVVPCVVLDPFFGAGTTGLVADELGRDCIGIELNPEYAEMARQRIYGAAPIFAAVEVA